MEKKLDYHNKESLMQFADFQRRLGADKRTRKQRWRQVCHNTVSDSNYMSAKATPNSNPTLADKWSQKRRSHSITPTLPPAHLHTLSHLFTGSFLACLSPSSVTSFLYFACLMTHKSSAAPSMYNACHAGCSHKELSHETMESWVTTCLCWAAPANFGLVKGHS